MKTYRHNGFTIVELLVVIAIIAILSALIIPALSRSKQAGQRAVCVNNLRQLGFAAQMYWDDHEGRMFRFRGGTTNGGDIYWFGWLERGAEGKRKFDLSQGVLFPYLGGKGVEVCPALQYRMSEFKLKALGASYGYGYNLHLSPALNASLNINQVRHPQDIALFADAGQVNTFQAPASPDRPMLEEFYYISTNEPTVHFRHSGKASTLFCDGHVSAENMEHGSLDDRLPTQKIGRLPLPMLTPK
ncbi:MAG: prepilin-type N-terminal cleavage/methylation domain-containing protein [Verrucomicrobiota bacterium]|nr:prepilin-type N-terminal cleavage/methylation domain-containing protein [Verrucomicrobiota bacterium]